VYAIRRSDQHPGKGNSHATPGESDLGDYPAKAGKIVTIPLAPRTGRSTWQSANAALHGQPDDARSTVRRR
jgi:hypothetical protein